MKLISEIMNDLKSTPEYQRQHSIKVEPLNPEWKNCIKVLNGFDYEYSKYLKKEPKKIRESHFGKNIRYELNMGLTHGFETYLVVYQNPASGESNAHFVAYNDRENKVYMRNI